MGIKMATSQADGGFVDIIQKYAKARQLKEFLDAYLGGLKSHVLDELDHQENGKSQQGLVLIERMNSGDKIDYAKDPIYANLQQLLKIREELLKQAKKSTAILVDKLTGEEIPSLPIKTYGKTVVKATLK